MIYALLLFVTTADGQYALHPVDYHFRLEECERERARLQVSVEVLQRTEGWRIAQLRCIPIPAAEAPI